MNDAESHVSIEYASVRYHMAHFCKVLCVCMTRTKRMGVLAVLST